MTVLSRTGDKSTSHVEHVEAGDNTPTVRVPVLTQIPVVGHIEIGHPTLLDSDIEFFTLLPSSWVDDKAFLIHAIGDDMTSAGMLSEEESERLNRKLNKLSTGMKVRIFYHKSFHDSESVGRLNCVDCEYGFLILDHERIYFDDIYSVRILEVRSA